MMTADGDVAAGGCRRMAAWRASGRGQRPRLAGRPKPGAEPVPAWRLDDSPAVGIVGDDDSAVETVACCDDAGVPGAVTAGVPRGRRPGFRGHIGRGAQDRQFRSSGSADGREP